MKMRLFVVAAAALCLAACGNLGGNVASTGAGLAASAADSAGVPAPNTVADNTTLDEDGMLRLEGLYKAARTAVELGTDAGVIKGTTAARVARADNEAFHWLGVLRSAYDTANATSFANAKAHAEAAFRRIWGD